MLEELELDVEFFMRPSSLVAPELLGRTLVLNEHRMRICEVEAYGDYDDPASHAFRGLTPRCATMFAQPGSLYVYFTYGMHHCANIVAHEDGRAGAVLLRGLEELDRSAMLDNEAGSSTPPSGVTVGPARICRYLGLTRSDDGRCLGRENNGGESSAQSGLYVRGEGVRAREVLRGPRVGVSQASDLPWRFWIADSRYVSRFRSGKRRA